MGVCCCQLRAYCVFFPLVSYCLKYAAHGYCFCPASPAANILLPGIDKNTHLRIKEQVLKLLRVPERDHVEFPALLVSSVGHERAMWSVADCGGKHAVIV